MAEGLRKRGKTWSYYVSYSKPDGSFGMKERGGFKTKKEASVARITELEALNNGMVLVDDTIKFQDYAEKWLEKYIKPPKRKITTYERYTGILKKYLNPYFGHMKLKSISPQYVEDVLDAIREDGKVSETTLQGVYGLLSNILERAVKTRVIRQNVCQYVERPRREEFKANVLTIDEIVLLLKALDTDKPGDMVMRDAIMITLEVGWRRGEAAGCDIRNIDFEASSINVCQNLVYSGGHLYMQSTKGGEERMVYCSEQLMEHIKRMITRQKKGKLEWGEHYISNEINGEPFEPLMRWPNGKYVHPMYFTTRFGDLLKKLGIEKRVRWHDLRHTNATLQVQQNINYKVIQERLGHKDISTTLNLYAHVNKELQDDSAKKLQGILNY